MPNEPVTTDDEGQAEVGRRKIHGLAALAPLGC